MQLSIYCNLSEERAANSWKLKICATAVAGWWTTELKLWSTKKNCSYQSIFFRRKKQRAEQWNRVEAQNLMWAWCNTTLNWTKAEKLWTLRGSAESSHSVRSLGKSVSGEHYPRLCNARRPRLEPRTFQSQAVRLYRLHQARPSQTMNFLNLKKNTA